MIDSYGRLESDIDVTTVNYHLSKIYESGELQESATIRKFPIVQKEGEGELISDFDKEILKLKESGLFSDNDVNLNR